MISGTHTVIFTKDPVADRAFFRDVLKLNYVDSGGGWLIFALPPSEVGMHPIDESPRHELYLICDNIKRFVDEMKAAGYKCKRLKKMPWGTSTFLTLPGGSKLGIYEPSHPRPLYRKPKR